MIKKVTKAAQVRSYVAKNPKATPKEVADAVGVGIQYVYTVLWTAKKKAGIKKAKKATLTLKAMAEHKQIMDDTIKDWKNVSVSTSNTSVQEEVDKYYANLKNVAPYVPMAKDTVTKLSPNRMALLAFEAGNKPKARMQSSDGTQRELFDPVNHPAHYKVGGIETIDFIEAKKLGYNLGNVVKYLTRAEHKGNRKQDLEKAKWYLERELSATT
jgi:hypothetical protein